MDKGQREIDYKMMENTELHPEAKRQIRNKGWYIDYIKKYKNTCKKEDNSE